MLMLASPSGVRRLQAHASRLYALIGSAEGAKSLDQSADFQQTRGFAADDGRQGGAASRPSTSTSMAAAQPRRDRSQRYMADPRSASAPSDDLAMANAPKRVLALIGDPRTGVADDTSNNPFGDVTVDMIHHSLTNEVYWFKYEFSGQSVSATHRNGRLSDYSKNLMYLLRASDPAT